MRINFSKTRLMSRLWLPAVLKLSRQGGTSVPRRAHDHTNSAVADRIALRLLANHQMPVLAHCELGCRPRHRQTGLDGPAFARPFLKPAVQDGQMALKMRCTRRPRFVPQRTGTLNLSDAFLSNFVGLFADFNCLCRSF